MITVPVSTMLDIIISTIPVGTVPVGTVFVSTLSTVPVCDYSFLSTGSCQVSNVSNGSM